jgi:hypothetical protein
VLNRRDAAQGPGFVLADVAIGRVPPLDDPPAGFWLHDRGPVPAEFWTYQNWHGRRWYRRHGAGQTHPPRRNADFTGHAGS